MDYLRRVRIALTIFCVIFLRDFALNWYTPSLIGLWLVAKAWRLAVYG